MASRGAYALAMTGDLAGAVLMLEQGQPVLLPGLLDQGGRRGQPVRAIGKTGQLPVRVLTFPPGGGRKVS